MASTAQTSHGSVANTDGVVVRVEPTYASEQSDPNTKRFIFAYTIRIENESPRAVTLQSRHWIVVDANGRRHDVEGEGVVGQQPRIEPGDHFEYSSLCPLNTPWGTMEGRYHFVDADDNAFDAAIARFYLVSDEA